MTLFANDPIGHDVEPASIVDFELAECRLHFVCVSKVATLCRPDCARLMSCESRAFACLDALRDPMSRRTMGNLARESVLTKYSMEERARRLGDSGWRRDWIS